MKKLAALLMALTLGLSGCGGPAVSAPAKAPASSVPAASSAPAKAPAATPAPTPTPEPAPEPDIDLTIMNANMVYAQVLQMTQDPESYVGKTVRLEGEYYSAPGPQKTYYFAYVSDAAACCSQGLEFVLEENTPEEYPPEGAFILLEGVFETYTEEGDPELYFRLKAGAPQVLQPPAGP
ncbi:MAG: hypothetical protein IIV90_06510 [Oscillospiraceae bacterium]|nr:hypothetical protein [Oscillospiraceae bacterium]